MCMNKAAVLAAVLMLARPSTAADIDAVVKEMASRPGIKNASWGVCVKDSATGAELVSYNAQKNLVPASILKIFVGAAAFDRLGPDYEIKTGLYRDGKIENGFLNGNIYIRGAGDPSLGSQLIKGAAPLEEVFRLWTAAVKAAGIRVINGAVVGDESAFESLQPGSWAWEDIGNYYAAQPSALTVTDNLYKLYFKPAKAEGTKAEILRTEPYLASLKFENHMLTGAAGSGDNGYIFAFPSQETAVLRGSVPRGPVEFFIKGALPDPALFAAQSFGAYLTRAGVNSNKKPRKADGPPDYAGMTRVAEMRGAALKDIVRVANKRSFNLYAELLLRQLAQAGGKSAGGEQGIKIIRSFLAREGVDVSEMKLVDASGLSRLNTAKAENFTDLLCAVSKKNYFSAFRDTLVFPGDPEAAGHIRRMGEGGALTGSLRIKSGSLAGVRAYSGYLKTRKGRNLSFTFIINNYSADPADIDKVHEELLLLLVNNY